jgi:hypothetical protein
VPVRIERRSDLARCGSSLHAQQHASGKKCDGARHPARQVPVQYEKLRIKISGLSGERNFMFCCAAKNN